MKASHEFGGTPVQVWNAQDYAKNARFVAELGTPVVELLAVQPGQRILDLGCGDGALSVELMHRGATVIGVDSSPQLVAAACAAGVDARVIDAHALDFAAEFDAVFSNAALHWMLEPDQVIRGVKRALRRGGRFVAEFGGHGNVAAIRTALAAVLGARGHTAQSPWFFPTADEYTRRLHEQGFAVDEIALIPRPTPLPTGMRGWLDTFANPFLTGIDTSQRGEVLDAVEEMLAPMLRDTDDRWTADYVRLRFAAHRTEPRQ